MASFEGAADSIERAESIESAALLKKTTLGSFDIFQAPVDIL